jgi:hypothetical protein
MNSRIKADSVYALVWAKNQGIAYLFGNYPIAHYRAQHAMLSHLYREQAKQEVAHILERLSGRMR